MLVSISSRVIRKYNITSDESKSSFKERRQSQNSWKLLVYIDYIIKILQDLLNHQQKTFPSGRNGSVRAVRDTPVADYSAPSVKTTGRVTYRPPNAVSPFLLALSVSYFEETLWRCGQLWPYVGMGSLGTRLHRDCNAMGDAAKISPRVPSIFSWRSVGRWADMILPGNEDPRNCVDLRQSAWDQKLGKIECEFSLYDKRRWK